MKINFVKKTNNTQSLQKRVKNSSKNISNNLPETNKNPFASLPVSYKPLNISFKGLGISKLKSEMNLAEAVMLNLKNQYPTKSPSKVSYIFDSKKAKKSDWVTNNQEKLNQLRHEYPSCKQNGQNYIKNLFQNAKTKDNNLANCSELASLTKVALLLNGIKNVKEVSLVGYTNPKFRQTYDMDHTFLIVNSKEDFSNSINEPNWDNPEQRYGGNAYIVDPWLGIVDTVENALKVYEETWEKIPHYNGVKGYGFVEPYSSLNLDSKDINNLKNDYPELIVDKTIINNKRFNK